ncbi:hypothetical protein A3K82_02680 [Candidatus Pacearchaeota archaeon RBG_19FT_COMBO_34_9]|nr:MAG: hypothetical protein A3K82_02680 [Candidatus Pacearchaeota archaeon RBG_19FT_COMBO_34_9]OGJ16963.1 MAG: hypothetical protein A3K74_01055 [Candidatus Pacearchaeota archaeon RBG_13_33_26]
MCRLCQINPVYEFTNKRKLCGRCFIHYFEKKVLYTLRKFSLIKRDDIVGYKKENNFKSAVLEEILRFISEKSGINIVRLPNKQANKIAVDSSIDPEAEKVIKELIRGNAVNLKKNLPVEGKIIKPLYLFLDEEILLYAKLKKLKFSIEKETKDKIGRFIGESEKNHPEIKRAIVNSLLELYL